jgi:hypothetical protein
MTAAAIAMMKNHMDAPERDPPPPPPVPLPAEVIEITAEARTEIPFRVALTFRSTVPLESAAVKVVEVPELVEREPRELLSDQM